MFTIKSSVLKEMFTVGSKCAANKATIPALSCALMRLDDNKMTIASFNLEHGVVVCGCVEEHTGQEEILVPAALFNNLLASWSDAELKIEFKQHTTSMLVAGGGSNAEIKCIPATEFPPLRTVLASGARLEHNIVVKTADMRAALDRVAFAASNDEARPILGGIHMLIENGLVVMAAADGFRLSVDAVSYTSEKQEKFEITIPAKAVVNAVKIAKGDEIHIASNGADMSFVSGDVEYFANALSGAFPDYTQIIPTPGPKHNVFTVNVNGLVSALGRCKVMASDARIVRVGLEYAQSNLTLSTSDEEKGAHSEAIGVIKSAAKEGNFATAFNVDFFKQAMESVPSGSDVTFHQFDATNPVLALSDSLPNWKHIIMPMHLSDN